MDKFDKQRKAVSLSIRNTQRELLKAMDSNNDEWITECKEIIEGLQQTLKTIEVTKALAELIG